MLTTLALIGTSFAQTTTYVWDGDSLDAALVTANGAVGAQVIRIGPSASPYLVNDRDYRGVNITLEAIVPGTVTIGRANSADTRLFRLMEDGGAQTFFRFVGVNFAYGSGTRAVKLNDGSELEFEGVIVAPYAGTSDLDGGAIRARDTATVTITNSSFGASNARKGGHIYLKDNASLTITDSTFADASASTTGGGSIFSEDTTNTITINSSVFSNNNTAAATSFGGAIHTNGPLNLSGSHFEGNASAYGGAIYTDEEVHIDSTVFCLNDASVVGGALRVRSVSNLAYSNTIESSLFLNNSSSYGAGVTYVSSVSSVSRTNTLANNSFVHNTHLLPYGGVDVALDLLGTDTFNANNNLHAYGIGPYAFFKNQNGPAITDANLQEWSGPSPFSSVSGDPVATSHDPGFSNPGAGSCDPLSAKPTIGGTVGAFAAGAFPDADNDGFVGAQDCDDADPTVHKGAADTTCDGKDNDCNGRIDDGVAEADLSPFYFDADGDGYGGDLHVVMACSAPTGFYATNDDCEDTNVDIHPGATEICGDGIDEDCSGAAGVDSTWYSDSDGDGFGDPLNTTPLCADPGVTPGAGWVDENTDCDDNNPDVNPDADETCEPGDQNCDGIDDPDVVPTWWPDVDQDSFGDSTAMASITCIPAAGSVQNNADCNDANPNQNPNVPEVCDGVDNNCDGANNEGLLRNYYPDDDVDGYGSNTALPIPSCPEIVGGFLVEDNTDCNDSIPSIYPGASELCDGIDQDCGNDGDLPLSFTTYTVDGDDDGYGSDASGAAELSTCDPLPPAGYALSTDDCDDGAADVHPDAPEQCDAIDHDCDGDPALPAGQAPLWYLDTDGDGYGAGSPTEQCDAPVGDYVLLDGDCDETDPAIHPGATEACDAVDHDCDGDTTNGVPYFNVWPDTDGDGFGDASANTTAPVCLVGSDQSTNALDCDDTDPAIHPGAVDDTCDNDSDCDGQIGEDSPPVSGFLDADGDGYGGVTPLVGLQCPNLPVSATNDDCDDQNPDWNPLADEICGNAFDENCDGILAEAEQWWPDADGDGFGAGEGVESCTPPAGYVNDNTDCDDTDDSVNPDQTEQCDAVDHDCDGESDNGLPLTRLYRDADGDGFGDPEEPLESCEAVVAGYVDDNTDCDDQNIAINPDAEDLPDNGLDEDCDGEDATSGGGPGPEPTDGSPEVGPTPALLFCSTSSPASGGMFLLFAGLFATRARRGRTPPPRSRA